MHFHFALWGGGVFGHFPDILRICSDFLPPPGNLFRRFWGQFWSFLTTFGPFLDHFWADSFCLFLPKNGKKPRFFKVKTEFFTKNAISFSGCFQRRYLTTKKSKKSRFASLKMPPIRAYNWKRSPKGVLWSYTSQGTQISI